MGYTVRKLKIERTDQLDELARASGELYTQSMVWFWRTVRKQAHWSTPAAMMRLFPRDPEQRLHSHTCDAVVQSFHASLKSWRARRKTDPKARPPRRRQRFYRVQYKASAIRLKGGLLILANGRGNLPLEIPWRWKLPRQVEIGWEGMQYELRAVYKTEPKGLVRGTEVAGVDLGEVHLAAIHTGQKAFIVNGREVRSKNRYRNRLNAKLSARIDRMKRGSERRRRVIRSKRRQLEKINNQIRDILHKQSRRAISTLIEAGVQKVAIGDLRELRQHTDLGKRANQKIHQAPWGKFRAYLTYKAEDVGMEVIFQDEAYTSQTCPVCGQRKKPKGRVYRCKCGFEAHRDAVGAWNIRAKYLGERPVVGVMASPSGLRFNPHARCSLVSDQERIPCL
jgi:putative transposase